jgi:hypothetical protein
MKYKLTEDSGKCNYEGYNPKTKSMQICGCVSNILAGKNYVCKEHLNFALQSDRKPQVYALDGKEILIKRFKQLVEDFNPIKKKKESAWT